jgi:RNA polymerase sigma-70 factor (ECF subfamily)
MDTLMKTKPHGPPLDEAYLAQQAITDADAFAELYRRNVSSVYRYHLAHTGDAQEAEDLTSQTFVSALEGIGSYRGEGPFAAWLMGIATRKRMLFFRGRRPQVPLDALHEIPDGGLGTDQAAALRLQILSVSRALKQISRERAEAIVLCTFAGLTIREAAVVLHKNEAAVKMLLSRGLNDIRERTSLSLEVE